MKQYVFYLLVNILLINIANAEVIDYGVRGQTWPIQEYSALELFKEQGQEVIMNNNRQLKQRIENYVQNPKKGNFIISRALKDKEFYFDPSYTLSNDLYDHENNIIIKAGTTVNPLDVSPFYEKLVFFDINDTEQVSFINSLLKEERVFVKLIAINGNPINAAKELNKEVYFDQYYKLSEYFGITHVPAAVEQAGDKLLIKEIKL